MEGVGKLLIKRMWWPETRKEDTTRATGKGREKRRQMDHWRNGKHPGVLSKFSMGLHNATSHAASGFAWQTNQEFLSKFLVAKLRPSTRPKWVRERGADLSGRPRPDLSQSLSLSLFSLRGLESPLKQACRREVHLAPSS